MSVFNYNFWLETTVATKPKVHFTEINESL